MLKFKLTPVLALLSSLLLGVLPTTVFAELDVAVSGDGERMTAKQVTAVITAIDEKTRDITLQGPLGSTVTLKAGDAVTRFDEFAIGDLVQARYVESISGELRAPTEAERRAPWVELDAAGIAEANMAPGAAVGLVVRAVCTIEGMNRATHTVTVKDPRGNFHVIGDVNPMKMEGVALGDTVIITYSQAVALSLEKSAAPQ
jgi:hypothetical protein